MINKIKILVLFMVITCTMCIVHASASNFSDVPKDHWAYDTIHKMVESGIVGGYEDGTFKPDKYVTRGEMLKIFALSLGRHINEDVSGHWANSYAQAILNTGFSYDYGRWYLGDEWSETLSTDKFNPDQTINRFEAAMLLTYMHFQDPFSSAGFENKVEQVLSKYKDKDNMLVKAYVYYVTKENLMGGYQDECFHGERNLTRAELCTIVLRAFGDNLGKNVCAHEFIVGKCYRCKQIAAKIFADYLINEGVYSSKHGGYSKSFVNQSSKSSSFTSITYYPLEEKFDIITTIKVEDNDETMVGTSVYLDEALDEKFELVGSHGSAVFYGNIYKDTFLLTEYIYDYNCFGVDSYLSSTYKKVLSSATSVMLGGAAMVILQSDIGLLIEDVFGVDTSYKK